MSVRKSWHVALLASALVSACGSDKTDEAANPSTDADAGADAASPGEPDSGKDDSEPGNGKPDAGGAVATGCAAIELEKTADSVQYELPLHVPAAEEREYCQLVMLKEDLNLNWSD